MILTPKQWPECDRLTECRVRANQLYFGLASSTFNLEPTLDREGNIHQPPPPAPSSRYWKCETCGKQWSEQVGLGS